MAMTLSELNAAGLPEAAALLEGLYENSPWIARSALAQRPFASLAQLKHAMARIVDAAGRDAQVALVRAHPELAGKAMVGKTLTAESAHEQGKAGLSDCSAQEFARIQQLNADYNARFGWPFVLAVRVRAAAACRARRSSRPSSGGWPGSAMSNCRSACATSTASRRSV